jgi:hypothetical protein
MKDVVKPELTPEAFVRAKTTKRTSKELKLCSNQCKKFWLSFANEGLSQSRTDTRNNCTRENHKKEVKRVKSVFEQMWKILADLRQ